MYAGDKLKPGIKWDNNARALIWSQEQYEIDTRNGTNDEQRTMAIIAEISSSIVGCLKFTWDSPSCNENGKMPVLDFQMWIGLEKREKRIPKGMGEAPTVTKLVELKNIVLYQFSRNEIHRRLKNTSRELIDQVITEVLKN